MAKTIAGKALKAIWDTFKELFPSFIDKTYRKIEPELRQEISWITKFVSGLNKFIHSPVADVITQVIPGDADDKFLEWLRSATSVLEIDSILEPDQKAILSAKLVQERTGMELSQALITSQVVYKKENG